MRDGDYDATRAYDHRMQPVITEHAPALRELCGRHHVARLEVFGSATRQDFAPSSDIDFLVEFEPMSPVASADAYFGLLEGLEALFERRIDLIMWDAVSNPYFRERLDASRESVYAA